MRVFLVMLFLVAMGPVMALSSRGPAPSGIALVILPPWADKKGFLQAVNGFQIGPTSAPFGFLFQSGHPTLTTAAYDAGAWWVTGGAFLAAICGVEV